MGIVKRLTLVFALIFSAAFLVDAWFIYSVAREAAVSQIKGEAEKIRGILMAMRRIYQHQFLDSEVPLTDKTIGFLPAHSMSRISKDFKNWSESGIIFNNVSDRPRNPNNKADKVEMKAVQFFKKNKQEEVYFQSFQSDEGQPYLLYSRPIWVEPYCLKCHGTVESAPEAIRANYTTAYNYEVGDLRGVMSIKLPAGAIDKQAWSAVLHEGSLHLFLFASVYLVIVLTMGKYVKAPLNELGKGMGEIASGRYNQRLKGFTGELAPIEDAFNKMAGDVATQYHSLNEAKKSAEQANEAKSDFLASMSHELRTPLNAVLGFAQMLQYDPKSSLTQQQSEHVKHIMDGGEHLLDLVNQVLDLAKIEADQFSLNSEEIDLVELSESCLAFIAPLAKQYNVQIFNRLNDNSDAWVKSDRGRIKQVLLNILSNAVKYNKDGGSVTVYGEESGKGYYRISIEDTGIGISPEEQETIFQSFHRIGAEAYIAREGVGIGLAVTKLLVERLAGHIGCFSELGKGSVFWVEFPLATNTEAIFWNETLRVGIDEIDKDHRYLIDLLSDCRKAETSEEVDGILGELFLYAHYHFRREEKVMEICNYPDLESHCRAHKKFMHKVADLAQRWQNERSDDLLEELMSFLIEWITEHIKIEDQKLEVMAKGRQLEITAALKVIH